MPDMELITHHTHHTINQIGASQSLPLKSLMSSLGLNLWGNVSEPTRGYRADFDTIHCHDPNPWNMNLKSLGFKQI